MSARDAYACQIQACNILLIVCGLGSIGLAGSQFSRVGLENYKDIDLRLLNWFHVLSGCVGVYSVLRNHGSIVVKTCYCVSMVIGFATAVFYGFTEYRVVKQREELDALRTTPGFQETLGQQNDDYTGKIVIVGIMIGLGAIACVISNVACLLLDRLVIVQYPVYPAQSREQERYVSKRRKRLMSLAGIKLLLGLGTLGLAAFLEFEHEKVSGTEKWIKIALEHIAAMLTIVSAICDMAAVRTKQPETLNLRVALCMSIIAAVWCVKSVDHNTFPFFKNDLKHFYVALQINDPTLTNTSPRYIIVVVHGVLIAAYGLLFLLCLMTAVAAGAASHTDYLSMNQRIDKSVRMQSRLLSLLHLLWGVGLFALTILGLLDAQWRGEFLGGDLLWMAVLFAATGMINTDNFSTFIHTRFIMNVVCLGIAVEKMCASINLIYQYSSYPTYVNGDQRTFVAQIILISVTTGIFAAEALTSLVCAVIFGRTITGQPRATYPHTSGIHLFFSLGTLFYAVVITGCYIVFEIGKWKYSEVPIEVPFFRIGNGPFALAVFIVQLVCVCFPSLLASATLLHVIVAALALFTLSPAITNTYYLQALLQAQDVLQTSTQQEAIQTVGVILAAGSTLACIIATACGVICALRSSYMLHHGSAGSQTSTVVAPLEESFGTMRYQQQSAMGDRSVAGGAASNPASPVPVQAMEEQSVYWSADENPFYYHTSKRFYGQPYQIDSGFYGYSLANPQQGVHHHRRQQSAAAQTQLGHAFR